MRQKLTSIICCSGLLATCADPAPTPDPDELSITPFVNELFRRHLSNLALTEELSLAEVYGDKWKEFAVFQHTLTPNQHNDILEHRLNTLDCWNY